jgi:transcriptional regulator with XRE-family HTH domain
LPTESKRFAKAKGITQEELADRGGLIRTHTYRLEGGKQSMTLRTLKIIADALDVRWSWLVGQKNGSS